MKESVFSNTEKRLPDRIIQTLKKHLLFISDKSLWFAAVLASIMVLLVLASSFMRYLIGSPFSFTEEIVGLLFMATAFFTLPFMTMNEKHVDVTIVYDLFSRRGQFFLRLLSSALFFIFSLWFTIVTWEFAYFSYEIGSQSETSEIVLYPWMMIMPLLTGITAAICLFKVIAMTWILLTNKRKFEGNE